MRHRSRRALLSAALALIAIWAVLCGFRLVHAVNRLQSGVSTVEQARSELSTFDLQTTSAGPHLAAASTQFADAHRSIESPLLSPLRYVPYFGRQLQSLGALSGAAAKVTDLGRQTLTRVQALFASPHQTAPERAAVIRRLATVITALNTRIDGVKLGPSNALIPTLAQKRNTFVTDLNQLHAGLVRGTGAANAIADLLGGTRTYLLLTANNAEMRDGSGMFLQAGTLTTNGGRISLGAFRSTAALASSAPVVPVGGDLQARWGPEGPGADYRSLGLSPQFELNAPVAAALWKQETGQSVDGVLTVDVVALKDLLAVTGPVTAGSTTITTDNVEQTLFVDQYNGVTGNSASNDSRREELGALGAAVFKALQGPGTSLPKIAGALSAAVNGRHILAWSPHPTIERDWQAAGAGAELSPGALLLGLSNKGANKLDPYQQVTADLTTAPDGAETALTLTVKLINEVTTTQGLPAYTIGGEPGSPAFYYTGILALDFPRYAGAVRVSGGRGLVATGSDGPSRVIAVAVQAPPSGSVTVTYSFHIRGHHGTLRVEPSARVPPISWSTPNQAFLDDTAHTVSW